MMLSEVDDGRIMYMCSLGLSIHTAINDDVETSRVHSYTGTHSLHHISVGLLGLLSTAIFPKLRGQDYSKDTDVF